MRHASAMGMMIMMIMVLVVGGGRPLHAAPAQPSMGAPAQGRAERQPGDRMVQAGVGVVVAGLAGYGLMAAGLGIGNQAEDDLLPLAEREDAAARREVLARGQLGNRLAIAGAVVASVSMAVGIPLIIVGRRRHEAAMQSRRRATMVVGGVAGGWGLGVRGRF